MGEREGKRRDGRDQEKREEENGSYIEERRLEKMRKLKGRGGKMKEMRGR